MSLRDVLDLGTTIKKWTVSIDTFAGGHFKSFWLKKNALRWAKANWDPITWITLKNEISEKTIELNNPRKKGGKIGKNPNCQHQWAGAPPNWICLKCGATFNLSCEHGGSMACGECIEDFIKSAQKEEGSLEAYLDKHSW